ncbi:MAG: aminotransferase class V-fold PLP-dependent enzyme, partial [Nannocystaceae bacterium]
DVGMCPSTTRGIADIALAINWKPGDRIIVFTGEFPANVTPWQQVARTFALELVFVSLEGFARNPEEGLAALEQALPGTRLVAVSMVQFQTGLRMPICEMTALCHRYGAEILVDAVQGVGIVDFDATAAGIDYLSCGSHKWLMGFEGLGFVYIRKNRIHALTPRTAGWLSHEDPLGFLLNGKPGELRYDRPLRNSADFTEGGALNLLGIAALDAAVDCIEQIGVATIFQHVQAYLDALEPELVSRGFTSLRAPWAGGRSGSLSVELPSGVDLLELNAALAQAGIGCSTPDGKLRFAPHWPNCCERELPQILTALDGFLGASLFAAATPLEDELDDAFDFQGANESPPHPAGERASAELPPELSQKLGLPGTSLPAEFIVAPQEIGPNQAAWNLPSRPPETFLDRVRHALAHAILAPSIRNTQPWRWQLSHPPSSREREQATVALFEQPNTLPRTDPDGRFARISLGAALATLDLACENLGLESTPI